MPTIKEVSKEIKDAIKKLSNSDKLLLSLARELYTITFKRIFVEGKLVAGSKLSYNSGATLAGASSFATKSGANKYLGSKEKRKKLKWVTVNGNRLFEIAGGFKEIKAASGRNNAFDFTGQLKKSYTWGVVQGGTAIGFTDVKRLTPDGKATSTTNADIIEGLTDTKGDIFGLSRDEEAEVDKIINAFIEQSVNGK
jgi:hypothetical protein